MSTTKPETIDAYIATFEPDVRAVLQQVRATIREACPEATEIISYRMPAFRLKGVLIYFAAFKSHIGVYPPVRDPALDRLLAPFRGEKGNLKFPLGEPIPYEIIRKITLSRAKEDRAKAAVRVTKKPTKTAPAAEALGARRGASR